MSKPRPSLLTTSSEGRWRKQPRRWSSLPRQLDLMKLREARIGELLRVVQKKSKNFNAPLLIVIGGYALRAHVPFARHSRDCDFAVPKPGEAWVIDKIAKWF